MARPKLAENEKRIHEYKVNFNDFENGEIIERAAGRSIAYTIRELLLRQKSHNIVAPDNRKTAQTVRDIIELVNQMSVARQRELEDQAKTEHFSWEKQLELNSFPGAKLTRERKREAENHQWSQLNNLLCGLNAELLGYADNDD